MQRWGTHDVTKRQSLRRHVLIVLLAICGLTISLSTHSEGGLTAKDFDLATQIERLPHKPLK